MKIPQRHINRSYNYNTIQSINFNSLSEDKIKISELPTTSQIYDSSLIPIVDNNDITTKKISFDNFKDSTFNTSLSGINNINLNYNSGVLFIQTNPTGIYEAIAFEDNSIQKTSCSQKNIFDLGLVENSLSINYNYDKTIQLLSINTNNIDITKGSGWPTENYSVEALLKIQIATTGTTINWDIIDEWYNEPESTLGSGTYQVLIRAMGSNLIEGHYIGSKS